MKHEGLLAELQATWQRHEAANNNQMLNGPLHDISNQHDKQQGLAIRGGFDVSLQTCSNTLWDLP